MYREQQRYGDPVFAQLNRAKEQSREMRERGELRSSSRRPRRIQTRIDTDDGARPKVRWWSSNWECGLVG